MNPANSTKSRTSDGPRIMVAPEVPFARMEEALKRLGWKRRPDTSTLPSLLPGEPEFATWRHTADDSLLTYSFQPVVGLRVLSFADPGAGSHAAAVESAIDTLDGVRLVRLLRSSDVRDNLLGALAAGELRSVLLYSEVRALADHPDPRVGAAARRTLELLREEVLEEAELLASLPAYPGTPHARRQALRHWAAAGPHDPMSAKAVLGRALLDPDWEVRAGAIILAARAGLAELAPAMRDAPLPAGRAEGVHRLDGRILRAVRTAALRLLDSRIRPSERFSDPRTSQVDRCVAGAEPDRIDRFFWLVTALTTPQPRIQRPPHVPPELSDHGGVFRSDAIGVDFIWVPPLPHWLGAPDAESGEASLSQETSPGVFVAREPSRDECGAREIEPRLAALGNASGLRLELVTDHWREMAVWGADARLFPWGNGDEGARAPWIGPWGAVLTERPEWVVNRLSRAFETAGGPVRTVRSSAPSAALRLAFLP